MLRVVVFGAVCEVPDVDRDGRRSPTVYFNSPTVPETAEPAGGTEAAGDRAEPDPSAVPTGRGRFRGRSEGFFTTPDHAPRWQRLLERRREEQQRRTHGSVSFSEFADLSDGRRVIMRNDRGINWSWSDGQDPWSDVTPESLAGEARDYLQAEEEDCCPISPESVVEHVRRRYNLEIDVASVQAALLVPRRIEFGARLLRELSRHAPPAGASSGPAT